MRDLGRLIVWMVVDLFRPRAALEAEIATLRQQINVLRRTAPKKQPFRSIDRLIFVSLYRFLLAFAVRLIRRPYHGEKKIRPLHSEADYESALNEIERYFEKEPKPGTPETDRFDLLALIIEDYERKRWPIEPPDTIDAIRYRTETGGYTQADLGRLLGSRQRASDILTRKRPPTMRMAWRLHREWGIPAEALIAPPRSRGRRSAA
jgi:HTH-type transcriptional regulator / antitoxin HigA